MITINLDESGAKLDIMEDGQKIQKFLTIKSFQNCLLQDYSVDTGLLPDGVVCFRRSRSKIKIAMVRKAGIFDVKYKVGDGKPEEFRVPIPSLLWIFTLNLKNIVQITQVFALKTTLILPDTELYYVPFSNVYNTGKICWGDNTFLNSPMKLLVGLSSLPDIFFSRPFNTDLETGFMNGAYRFFSDHNGKTDFPYDNLRLKTTFKEEWKDEN